VSTSGTRKRRTRVGIKCSFGDRRPPSGGAKRAGRVSGPRQTALTGSHYEGPRLCRGMVTGTSCSVIARRMAARGALSFSDARDPLRSTPRSCQSACRLTCMGVARHCSYNSLSTATPVARSPLRNVSRSWSTPGAVPRFSFYGLRFMFPQRAAETVETVTGGQKRSR